MASPLCGRGFASSCVTCLAAFRRVAASFGARGEPRSLRVGRLLLLGGLSLAVAGAPGCEGSGAAASESVESAAPDDAPRQGDPSRSVLDDRGLEVRVAAAPTRVISVVPSLTELVVALDAGHRLVARTRFDREPAVAHLPSVGGTLDPNLEALVGFRPDLVVGWADEGRGEMGARMGPLGIPVYHARIRTLEELFSHTLRLGRLLDEEGRAQALMEAMEARLGAVEARGEAAAAGRGGVRPTVLYVVWHDPPQTAGPGTFLTELIELAGGRNVLDDAPIPWPVISMEEVLRRAPDALVVAPRHDGEVFRPAWLDSAPWQELEAVREDRVLLVDPDLFNRPGPRVVEAAEALEAFLSGLEFSR
jgi:iron complex transport system substrate-binding protein